MPGHADASNRAYPEFCGGGFDRLPLFTFNPGKEETYAYLKDILSEVAQLFPSQYMHLGGDEVHFGNQSWPDLKEVKDLMKRENLKNTKEVEIWFNRRMANVAKALGKTVIGWDEYLSCGLDTKDAVMMWWRHDKPYVLNQSVEKGYRTIMCPRRPLYFDFVQDDSHTQGRKWGGACTLQQVYEFPNLKKIPANQHHLIMGMQANLWTDTSDTFERLDFMVFPRLCALAESAWTNGEVKNFASFNNRMEYAYRLFDSLKIRYFDPRNPGRTPEPPNAKRNGKTTRVREDNQKK